MSHIVKIESPYNDGITLEDGVFCPIRPSRKQEKLAHKSHSPMQGLVLCTSFSLHFKRAMLLLILLLVEDDIIT